MGYSHGGPKTNTRLERKTFVCCFHLSEENTRESLALLKNVFTACYPKDSLLLQYSTKQYFKMGKKWKHN